MNKLNISTIVIVFFSTSFGNNLIGIDYGYIPSLSFHYNYNQSNLTGDTLIDYNQKYYNLPQIGAFYNHSISNRFILNISTEYYYKNIYNSKSKDTLKFVPDTFINSTTISEGENRIGIDFGVFYNIINNNNNIKLLIGPSLGYSLLWQSYFINYNIDNPHIDNNYSFSFYGSSPYLKMSCYLYINMFNHFGLRIGVDYVYSETIYKNPNKTIRISLNNGASTLFINGASKCYENQFICRIGIFYNL